MRHGGIKIDSNKLSPSDGLSELIKKKTPENLTKTGIEYQKNIALLSNLPCKNFHSSNKLKGNKS